MGKSYTIALFKYLLVIIFSINISLPTSLAQDYLRPPAARKSVFQTQWPDKDRATPVSYPFKVMVKNVTRITIDNPFFAPREDVFIRNEKGEKVYWEKYGVMHPAAFRLEEDPHTVYLIYRAVGSDGRSRGGLAIITLDDKGWPVEVKRFSRPILNVRTPGSADEQGCEDFRTAIMEIEEDGRKVEKIVMGYTAVSDSSLETVLSRIKAENKANAQQEVEKVIQYHKEHGYTGELFAQAAVATMDVSEFLANLKKWQLGEDDHIWRWERHLMFEGMYDKDVIPSHVDEKGNIVIWDRPNYIVGDKTKRAMRRCIAKSLKGPYIPTDVTISSQNPDYEDYPGGGSPPVRLKNGLLLMLDHRVKNNPTQLRPDHRVYSGGIIMEDGSGNILFRSKIPAIFPEYWWEKGGADHWWQKSKRDGGDLDLVFPTGLILLSESWDANGVGNVKLLVFYGARDQYAGAAIMELELYDTRRPKAVTAMHQETVQLKQELKEAKTTDEIIRAWDELGDLDAIGEGIKDILAGHIIKNSPHIGKKIDELKAVRYFNDIGLRARHKPIINMQKFISELHLLNESNGSGRKLGRRRNGLNIEVINPVIPPTDKPVLFVIDAHGTLFVPTWKQIYRRVYKEIKGKDPPAGWIEKQIIHKSRQEIIEALCKISDNYTEKYKWYLNKLIENIEADINKDVKVKARPGVLEFLKKAKATHTPVIIVSGAPRDVLLKQLEYAGLLKYIRAENVIGGSEESEGYHDRARVIRKIQAKHPGYTIAHWDDSWGMRGMDKTNEPGVICCGTPQGQPYSEEFDYNREELKRAGADYIFHGWRNWNDAVSFFVSPEVQKDYDDIVISDEFRQELTEVTYPAVKSSPAGRADGKEVSEPGFSSFQSFMAGQFGKQGAISFADIGCGPKGEFGQRLSELLSRLGININKDSVSIDNAVLDEEAKRQGKVKFADINIETDRIAAGLIDESKDVVSINNIDNVSLIEPSIRILKPGGVLMVTFTESDKYDSPGIIRNAKLKLSELSEGDPDYEYRLLGGASRTVRMPADYPESNSMEKAPYKSQEDMLVVIKVKKTDTLVLGQTFLKMPAVHVKKIKDTIEAIDSAA